MSSSWFEAYLGLIFQVYGLAFFVLGVAALLSMRRDTSTGLAAHLGWLAAFGMLHGLQEFIDGERLHNPAAWLVVLSAALMVVSFAALLELGRRLWNERPGDRRLAALPLYAAAGLGTMALMLLATVATAGLELGARYLLGAPGAALAGIGLLAQARATARAPDTVAIIRWLRMAAFAMLGYAALTLFLSPGSGRLLADWLPTTADFLATTGLPVQLARALCAVLLAVGFVVIGQRGGRTIAESLQRVTDRLDGFVYRCRNDRSWSVSFMSEGGETLTGYPAADFLRGARHFADQIHPDDQQRVWDGVQAALSARHDFRLQYRMIDRAGTVRWCYEEGRGVFDTRGELLYLEGLVRNDDARHQAEDARRRMQAMVEASPQAMGWADPDGAVRYFNAALRTLLAVPKDAEVSGYRLRDFYDDKAYAQIEATVLPAVAAQGAWVGEIELTALDGRSVPTLHSVFVLRDAAGEVSAFANVINDLSAMRAADRELRIKDTAIASSTSAIALAGLDGVLTYVNQAFVALWGLAGPEEALGRSALSFWDEPDQAQAVVDTLARTGRWQGELLGRRADGSRLDVQLTGHMVLDHDGKPLCMMGSFMDVTARNQAQQALQRERDFAQSLLDTTPAIILLMDPQGMIRHVNPWFEQLTGYRLDEIVGKEWFATFLPERDQARIRALFASALHDQPVRGNINPIVTRDGEERAIEWHAMPLRDADGQMTGLLSIGMDVTERQRIGERIRVSETRLNEAQHIAKVGSWELDLVSGQLFWTDEIFNLFELDKAQFDASYEAFLDAIHPDDRDKVNAAYTQSLADRKPYVIIHRLRMADGRIKWVEERCSTGFDADGKPLRSRGTVQDITERQQLEDKLHELNQSLEQRVAERTAEAERANAAKSEFLSRMSHELRTPLNAILGFAQILQLPGEQALSTQQADNVHEIHHAGEHLLGLVNEVLDLARIESGRLEITPEPVALQPMIERCAAQIEVMARVRGVRLTLHMHEPCTVLADSLRLQQVLLNLLSNAVKYNREGGRIKVLCEPAAQQRVRVSVRDSGRGLSAEQQGRLFRPFERLESAYEGIEGTGIGLALAKQLVEGMQGSIGVDSVPGEGSTFWFELPLATVAAPGDALAPTANAIASPPGEQRTVLYVEDNPANLKLVKKLLTTRTALALIEAPNAELGLEIAARARPDLILMDINLPGMDGFEALRRLKENPATRGIPVIAVTSNAMARDVERGRAAGFSDYLTKPIDIGPFLATIDRCLAGAGR